MSDDDTPSRLIGLNNAKEREYRLKVDVGGIGEMFGFIKPSQLAYNRDRGTVSQITATGGIDILKDIPYAQSTNPIVTYTGRDSIFTILERCYQATGFDFDFIVNWYDFYCRSTGGFEPINLDAMKHQAIENERYLDENGNPFSCYDVLME